MTPLGLIPCLDTPSFVPLCPLFKLFQRQQELRSMFQPKEGCDVGICQSAQTAKQIESQFTRTDYG